MGMYDKQTWVVDILLYSSLENVYKNKLKGLHAKGHLLSSIKILE